MMYVNMDGCGAVFLLLLRLYLDVFVNWNASVNLLYAYVMYVW
jgi:hypothetical protein